MDDSTIEYGYFYKAMKEFAAKKGRGFQTFLALSTEIAEPTISDIMKQKRLAKFDQQVKIAKALGYEYVEFILYGKSLLQGGDTAPLTVNESATRYETSQEMPLIGKADLVLNSDTIYGAALKQNIEAFYQAYLKEKSPKKTNPELPSGAPKDAAGDAG